MIENLSTVLGEVTELSAAVSQMRKMLLQFTDAINQDSQFTGSAADGADQTTPRSGRRFILRHKTYKQHENNVAPRNTGLCVRM